MHNSFMLGCIILVNLPIKDRFSFEVNMRVNNLTYNYKDVIVV